MLAIDPDVLALSDADRRQLESLLLDFDKSWSDGCLDSWVGKLPARGDRLRLPALREMVKIDMDRQWHQGRRVGLEDYLQRYADLGTRDSVPPDLIHAEYEVRQQFGATADLANFAKRFPRQAVQLRQLLTSSLASGAKASKAGKAKETVKPSASVSERVPKANSSELPEQFGRYRILKKLGQGGMGAVYLAQDAELDRSVALKVPHFAASDGPAVLERFKREARAAATLTHPNICPVFDVGEIDGIHYLTMAFIEGKPLTEIVHADKPPTQRAVANVIRKLALALNEAHQRGVIHRDLKPANIMINLRKEPVIMDFGLARRANKDEARITKSGSMLGTPAYMSPEQVSGDIDAMGAGCDIYSLGVIMYELLAGVIPFEGPLMSVLAQVLTQQPQPPSKHRPGIAPALEAICLKAMAKKPEDRFVSMAEFAGALEPYLRAATKSEAVPGTPNASPTYWLSVNESAIIAPLPKPMPMGRRTWPLWVAGVGSAVFGVLMVGVFVFTVVVRVKTKDGIIELAGLPPDAEVSVDGSMVTVESLGTKAEIRVSPDVEHEVVVKVNGATVQGRRVKVAAGEREVFSVKVVPQRPKTNVREAPEKPGPAPAVARSKPEVSKSDFLRADNWECLTEYWKMEGTTITGTSPADGLKFNTYLCSKQKYRDFELKCQVRLKESKGNSGVQIRSNIHDLARFAVTGPQGDIGDGYWGCLYGENFGGMMKQVPADKINKMLKIDDFNDYNITCVGKHVTITINGEAVVDNDFEKLPDEGIIAFQLHSGGPMEVTFKNIEFKEVNVSKKGSSPIASNSDPRQASAPFRPRQNEDVAISDGFLPFFNGKDLSEWVHVDNQLDTFRVVNGEIVASGKATGTLRTKKMYENFVLEFEWMHENRTEIGNSGVFIWGSKECANNTPFHLGIEVQVLVNFEADWATSHGDVFSVNGAKCRPDRPHPKGMERCLPSEQRAKGGGQWNHYKIVAVNGRIKLHVNGKEVSGVTECKPRKGFIGLNSEGAVCHFRNFRIKELPSTNPRMDEIAN